MNKHLKEALLKQQIRKAHRDAIGHAMRIDEAHPLWDAFVKPFGDVIDAAKLTGADLLNVARLGFDTFFTLSPKKKRQARERFNGRKADIDKEWEPLMKKADDVLGNNDLAFASFMFNPAAFLLTKSAEAAYDKAGDLNQYLTRSGWKVPIVGTVMGLADYTGPGEAQVLQRQQAEEDGKSLLDRMLGLFYIESAWHNGDLLVEQDEEKESPKKPPFKKAMEDWMKQTGLTDKFEADGKKMIEAQQEFVDTILEDVLPRLTLAKTLVETTDIEEFLSMLEQGEATGIELEGIDAPKIRTEIEAAAQKLMQDEDFIKGIAQTRASGAATPADAKETASVNPEEQTDLPEVPEAELRDAATKIAFINAKKAFEEQSLQGLDKLKEDAIQTIEEQSPNEATLSSIKGTPLGAQYAKVFEDAKQKIEAA